MTPKSRGIWYDPDVGPQSESAVWLTVRDHARAIQADTSGAVKNRAEIIETLCNQMMGQLRQGIHENPDLAIMALGANPPRRRHEWDADLDAILQPFEEKYGQITRTLRKQLLAIQERETARERASGFTLLALRAFPGSPLQKLFQELRDNEGGTADNPPRGELFGQDVLGIVYQHEDDRQGERRVHLFGKGGQWRETRGGRGVELYNLPATTGVFMEALGDKKVVLAHRRDLPLVGEF